MITLSALLYAFSGLCKAIADASGRNSTVLPSSWIKSNSWKNKWKNGDPSQGEAFPLSSTALVIFTDVWHMCDFLRDLFLVVAVAVYPVWWAVLIGFFFKQIMFELLYSKIK